MIENNFLKIPSYMNITTFLYYITFLSFLNHYFVIFQADVYINISPKVTSMGLYLKIIGAGEVRNC